jgi:hypothetical protein
MDNKKSDRQTDRAYDPVGNGKKLLPGQQSFYTRIHTPGCDWGKSESLSVL